MLVTVPQRGLQIANVDVKLVRNAFQLRLTLEKEATAQFAVSATDDQLDALEAAHRDSRQARAKGVTPACSTPPRRWTGDCTTRSSTRSATRSSRRSIA
jgi:DNA-binding GntR family transcriptional regulator